MKKINSATKPGGLLCERLAKAPKIPIQASHNKTHRVNRTKPAPKKAISPIPTKPRTDSATAVKTSTGKKTPAPPPPPPTGDEDELKKAIRAAEEAKKARVLFRRKQERIEELRRAAREALEKLELSVEVDDSHKSVRDLERICGEFQRSNILHFIGLCLKN